MNSFRVLMVAACPFPQPRGTPIRVLRLAETLGRRGHEVDVVAYHLGTGSEPADYRLHRCRNIRTYRKLSPGPSVQKLLVVDPALVIATRRVLASRTFDLIHAHHFEGLLVSIASAGRTLPIVFDVHTLLENELPECGLPLPRRLAAALGRFLDRHVPARATRIVAASEKMRDRLQKLGVDPRKLSVIASGVESELFEQITVPTSPASRHTLIFTGNLAPYQGIDAMIEAFARLRRLRQDVVLKIVTESDFGPYRQRVAELGLDSAIEIVADGFDHVPTHLAGANVALNPRTNCFGVPQKLLNYMAAGKPTVSFAGSAKSLTHGETGLVVEDGNIDAFAEAVHQLLDHPEIARRMGAKAQEYARGLSWSAACERFETVYEDIAPRTLQAPRPSPGRR